MSTPAPVLRLADPTAAAAAITRRREAGFSFIEVIIAMGILIVGSVSVLGLFTIGVNRMVKRRVDARLVKVMPEIESILQTAVDQTAPGDDPANIPSDKAIPLSRRGYKLAVEWTANPFKTPGFWANAQLIFDGTVVRRLQIPITRSFLDPSKIKKNVPGGRRR